MFVIFNLFNNKHDIMFLILYGRMIMKKLLKLSIIAILLIVATACQKEEEQQQQDSTNTNQDYYLVYTMHTFGKLWDEHIYYGRSEDSFKQVYEESTTNDLCGTAYIATTQYYTCKYIYPIGDGFQIDSDGQKDNYLDLNQDELITSDLKGRIYFNYEANEFQEVKFSFGETPDVHKILAYNRDLSQFIFEDRGIDLEVYHYNKQTNKLTSLPSNHVYYQIDPEFSKFIGYDQAAHTIVITDVHSNNEPFMISNIYNFSYLGNGVASYYHPENIHQLKILRGINETITIENEAIDFSRLQPYAFLGMIDAKHYAFIYDNQFYVYNIETPELIDTIGGIQRFYTNKDVEYTVLASDSELMFYQPGQDMLTVEIDSNYQIAYDIPIMTEHFVFYPDTPTSLLVNKDTGSVEQLQYGKVNIAYLLGPNRLYVNFSGYNSIIISPSGIEELTWIRDYFNK
jgi:hypothetical protein